MKKYVRTKDGIFEFAKRFNLEHYRKVGFSDFAFINVLRGENNEKMA